MTKLIIENGNTLVAEEVTIQTLQIGLSTPGPKGDTGASGTNGTDGADGADGLDGAPGANGVGVPVGGTTGQVLKKTSDTDYATEWGTVSGGGSSAWGGITGTLSDQTDLQSALDAKASASGLSSHIADTANPHSVTKSQVGLSDVDNTSDANKPVSTAQGVADAAVQSAASSDATTKANAAQAHAIQRANHTGTQLLATISDAGTLASQSGTFSGTSSGTNTGDQNLFGTIVVSGQSDVVADSTSDTLTLVAGTNVTITTNAGADSITIAASGGGSGASIGQSYAMTKGLFF